MNYFFDYKKIIENAIFSFCIALIMYIFLHFFPTLNCQDFFKTPTSLFNKSTYGKVSSIRPHNENLNIIQYYFYIDKERQYQEMEMPKNIVLNSNETVIIYYDAFDYFDSKIIGRPKNFGFNFYLYVSIITYFFLEMFGYVINHRGIRSL